MKRYCNFSQSSVFSIRSFTAILFLLFFLCFSLGFAQALPEHSSVTIDETQLVKIEEGLKLVETFYEHMFSDINLKACPDIFVTSGLFEVFGRDLIRPIEIYQVWKFIRQNKSLFVHPNDSFHSQEQLFQQARKGYSWNLARRKIDESNFIMVATGMKIDLKYRTDPDSGIEKIVSFPITFCPGYREYRIDYTQISVNGIYVDWSTVFHRLVGVKKYERNFDLFEHLGFSK